MRKEGNENTRGDSVENEASIFSLAFSVSLVKDFVFVFVILEIKLSFGAETDVLIQFVRPSSSSARKLQTAII